MTSAKLERKKFLSTLKFGESHVNFGLYLVKIWHNFYDQDWQTLKDQIWPKSLCQASTCAKFDPKFMIFKRVMKIINFLKK